MIAAFIQEKHTTWDDHIAEFAFAYNTAIHEATKCSPAFLNYGRNPEPPHSAKRKEERAIAEQLEIDSVDNWRARMENLDDFRANANENSKAAQERQEIYYNAKHRDVSYSVGDKVWAKNRVLSSAAQAIAAKLSPKFAGPFFVAARLGMNTYQLRNESGVDIGKVAVCDLKPCHDAEQFPADYKDEDACLSESENSSAPSKPDAKPKTSSDACEKSRSATEDDNAPTVQISATAPKKRGRPPGKKNLTVPPKETSPRRLRPRTTVAKQD